MIPAVSEWPVANSTTGMPARAPPIMGRKSTRATHSAHRNGNGTPVSIRATSTTTPAMSEVNHSVAGYMLGNLLTSLIAGVVVLVALMLTGVPFPFLWALWVALVDFLPMIGGAHAGIPVVLFATGHSLTARCLTTLRCSVCPEQ